MSNSIEKQKHSLIGMSIAFMIIGFLALVGGIVLLTFGLGNINEDNVAATLKIVFGAILILAGGVVTVLGLYLVLVGSAVRATKGSIAEDNIPNAGTVNMLKCENCGSEVHEGDKVCGNCGHSLSDEKVCSKCGATNSSENKKCSACGADLAD